MILPQLFELPCRVRFTTRRGSIALRILEDEVRILAPRGTAESRIAALLRERRHWIESTIVRMREQQRGQPPPMQFADGDTLHLDGKPLTLLINEGGENRCDRNGDVLLLSTSNDDREQRLATVAQWYQQQAEQRWPAQVENWAQRTGLTPSGVKIRRYKSRWGACTAQGLISLNTLLLQAPVAIQEYVIVHELCHLRHLDHSRDYWALVGRWCPDYADRRRWLRQQGPRLQLG